MLSLELKRNVYKIDEKSMENLLIYVDARIQKYFESEYDKEIKSIFDEIRCLIQNYKKKLIEISKLNIQQFFINYLKQFTLENMYDYFIVNIIPRISIIIYNQKIEKYLKNIGKKYRIKCISSSMKTFG